MSLGKGGSILAIDVLTKIKEKQQKGVEDELRKAKRRITTTENKAKEELRVLSIVARKVERERLRLIKEH